jgi:hypothetical protein
MASVEMFPTLISEEVIPVWSLKALEGMDRLEEPDADDPPPLPDVVVVDAELVELQATTVIPATATIPSAARRVFHGADPKVPP